MIKINGVTIATPNSFSVSIEDINGQSVRNANGDLYIDRISTKVKIDCSWPPLDNESTSVLLKAVKDTFFSVEYPDPVEGELVSKTMYVESKSVPIYSFIDGKAKWNGLKMTFSEK